MLWLYFLQWEEFEQIQSLRDHAGEVGVEEFPPAGWWGVCLRQEERSSVSGTAGGPRGKENRGEDEAVPAMLIAGNLEGKDVHPCLFLILHFIPLMGKFLKIFFFFAHSLEGNHRLKQPISP